MPAILADIAPGTRGPWHAGRARLNGARPVRPVSRPPLHSTSRTSPPDRPGSSRPGRGRCWRHSPACLLREMHRTSGPDPRQGAFPTNRESARSKGLCTMQGLKWPSHIAFGSRLRISCAGRWFLNRRALMKSRTSRLPSLSGSSRDGFHSPVSCAAHALPREVRSGWRHLRARKPGKDSSRCSCRPS